MYENFKDLDCDFAKYVSEVKGKLMIHIIDFKRFRRELLDEYNEDEIRYFFRIFPYTMDTELNDEIKQYVVRQEIEYYKDFQLVTISSKEYVLVDESSDMLEPWYLLERIESQPIPFEDFLYMVFDDIVIVDTGALLFGVESNLKKKDKKEEKPKFIETSMKDGVYI